MKPEVKNWRTKQEFYWKDEHIYALVDRIREHRDGRVTSEVNFKTDLEGMPPHILRTQTNLLSTRSKQSLTKDLQNKFPSAPWEGMIEQLSTISLNLFRTGTPAEEIWPEKNIPSPEFLVHPLLYKNKPTIFFGEGASAKSLLALALALFVTLPYTDNVLGLRPQYAKALYLDYESDSNEMKRRVSSLVKGFGIPETPVLYRECSIPILQDVDNIENIIAENNIGLVIIDSLGVAVAGEDLNSASAATGFFSALRRLKVTPLIISHVVKDEEKRKNPYGSIYFANLARSTFYVKRQQEDASNVINVALFHKKNNQGPLLSPMGFRFLFEDDKTIIQRQSVDTVPEFLESLSLKSRIAVLLKNGSAPVGEIAEELEASENTVSRALNRHREIFIKLDKDWGLLA